MNSEPEQLENILNSSGVAMLFLDDTLTIRFFTPAAQSLFSVIPSDIGRPLADLAHHFSGSNILADAASVLANRAPVARDVMAANGARYNCRILPYRTKEGGIEGVVITFSDVTARKRAEEAATLAKVQSDRANLAKSQFLAAASHDLRQPLQTLSLLQGLLAKKIEDPATLRLVSLGDAALRAMSGMLNTLLDINQLEAGIIRPELAVFSIDTLIERLKAEFSYLTQARGLAWHVLSCRHLVLSDTRLLEQMLRNLLTNAVKYTSKGGVLLGCRRRAGKLRIEIWDTGLGIPEAQLPAIFEEFHQIDNARRESSCGLGLGLAIVKRLGDLLDHAVDVRSRLGRGSVFSIEVPLAAADPDVLPRAVPHQPDLATGRTGKVLIVEDDPEVRASLELLLHAEGHVTASAADGREGIDLVLHKDAEPDIAIVDYNLPDGLTGLEVIAGLHAIMGRDMGALVLTGDISTATLRQIAEQGYVPLHKPVAAAELNRQVCLLLARSGSAAPLPTGADADAQRPVTIYIVDDDRSAAALMRDFLDGHGWKIETRANCEAFLRSYKPGPRACLILDEHMPGMDGLELLRRLRAQGDSVPVIMVTGYGDVRLAVQAMKAGALDIVEKPVARAALLASIRRVLAQDDNWRRQSRANAVARLSDLSIREREVLDRVLAGQPSKNIAADLGVSQRTVENHRAAVMKKAGAKSLPELVRLAVTALAPKSEIDPGLAANARHGGSFE